MARLPPKSRLLRGAGEALAASGVVSWPISFMKSTRKSAANGSSSCGTATASSLIALAVLIVAGIGAWRGYEWWHGQEGRRRRRPVRAGGDLERAGQAEGGAGRLRQARRRGAGRLPHARQLPRRRRPGEGQAGRSGEGLRQTRHRSFGRPDLAGSRDRARRHAAGRHRSLRSVEAQARAGGRGRPSVPRHRARAAGAVGLGPSRLRPGAALHRRHHGRSRNLAGHAQPRRTARGADRRHRQAGQQARRQAGAKPATKPDSKS